jgi:hypothetical protein
VKSFVIIPFSSSESKAWSFLLPLIVFHCCFQHFILFLAYVSSMDWGGRYRVQKDTSRQFYFFTLLLFIKSLLILITRVL